MSSGKLEASVDLAWKASHLANFGAGVYKGYMNMSGVEVDSNIEYLLPANAITTGAKGRYKGKNENFINTEFYEDYPVITGTVAGAVASPIEFVVGWIIGYVSKFATDKIFF
jgi:hypothetical protein